jgi:imidazolonepropionase-like amidohydrolase
MRFRSLLLMGAAALVPLPLVAQTAPTVGLRENPSSFHALTGARVVAAPGNVVENATVVIRNGVIESVTADGPAPAGARVWSMTGRTIYPGFIDAYTQIGMPDEVPEEERGPVNWNRQVRSFTSAADEFADDGDRTGELRQQGFTTALALPGLGIFRGTGAVVSLGDGGAGERVLRSGVVHGLSLVRDNRAGGGYPTSAMGAITFIRQTFHDADWYDRAHRAWAANPEGLRRPERDRALEALVPVVRGDAPVVFQTRDEDEYLRAVSLADEFSVDAWFRGSGYEYRILEQVQQANRPLLLPLDFPSAPNVASPEQALGVSLEALRHWDLAPENPGRLAEAGVRFALTADGLSNGSDFLRNLRTAVSRGLPSDAALAALTTTPAQMLGVERTHGTVAAGKVANLVVAEGDVFSDDGRIVDVWVDGERYEINADDGVDPRGRWVVAGLGGAGLSGELELTGQPGRLSGVFRSGGQSIDLASASLTAATRRLALTMPGDAFGHPGTVRLSATVEDDHLYGFGDLPDGTRVNFRGERAAAPAEPAEPGNGSANGDNFELQNVDGRPSFAPVDYDDLPPAMEFGRRGHVLVRNATVWTMGPEGILENADLLVSGGRVAAVGQGLSAPAGATVIDAAGRHVTPGLIDAHIHSGLSGGVNETGSAMVPEVRIGDVLTANNIWSYRQLAGGLTTAHVMHGSANPIGGQNQLVKMRWGGTADEYKIEDAPRTVKFALGENPVRREDRYPDTRMGTEQIIRDHFMAAREYMRSWEEWERSPTGIPPSRDLRMEALVDMINGDISIQSHSYRQDEILMLMRLAEELGLQIDAFHHGVEAYRVASELAAHGAAAVVWSDWGGFKIEAYNNTTYNVKVLLEAGVVTSLHSDNSEIAARMNWEAAKMLRTGVTEEEALALVTSSTAQVLGVGDRVGSLETGKDGDFVIWSHHPLSARTVAQQTWIEGRPAHRPDRQAHLPGTHRRVELGGTLRDRRHRRRHRSERGGEPEPERPGGGGLPPGDPLAGGDPFERDPRDEHGAHRRADLGDVVGDDARRLDLGGHDRP